jgi:photosystem II stability/assembly factor-like uncharacterized protein
MTTQRFWTARCVCACFLIASLSGMLRAQGGPRVGVVSAGNGWLVQNQNKGASGGDHLFWTGDDGNNWSDITPHESAAGQIAAVFFLDASHGWALLAVKHEPNSQQADDLITDISAFDVASTADGGVSWTIKRLASLPKGVGWFPAGQLFFLDATHGWLNIESPVPHWGGTGALLTTSDGGQTWLLTSKNTAYGSLRFTDLQNGWMAGGPGDQYLYATNDGGRHWKEAGVPPPSTISELFENVVAQYVLPLFKDKQHGFLSVEYSGEGKSGEGISIQALFSTGDSGNSWRLESSAKLDPTLNVPIVAIVDSKALAPKRFGHESISLLKLGLAGKLTETRASELPQMPANVALVNLNFNDVNHGWAFLSDGRLLSTSDGGITWKEITPSRQKMTTQPSSSPIMGATIRDGSLQSSLVASATTFPVTAASTISTYNSRHMGFDQARGGS